MAKKVNIENLERLYAQAQNFKNKAESAAESISRNIQYLANPSTLDGLRGGQGDAAVEAILSAKTTLEDVRNRIGEIGRFLDEKIGGAIQLAKDKQGFSESKDKARSVGNNIKRT